VGDVSPTSTLATNGLGVDPTDNGRDNGPIFILSLARTGSTLLRCLLGAHEEIAAPGETNLSAACEHIFFTFHSLYGDTQLSRTRAVAACRDLAHKTLASYAHSQGKPRWCDKSLTSLRNAYLLVEIFPEAQFICLYRNSLDFIASAIEASRWGYGGYGFEPYVRHSPENVVRALSQLWAESTDAMIGFTHQHHKVVHQLRYEDLATDPTSCLHSLGGFLGLRSLGCLTNPERVLQEAELDGPGDHKISFTDQVAPDSIGRGWGIPRDLIPAPLRAQIDQLHAILQYSSISFTQYSGVQGDSAQGARVSTLLAGTSPSQVPKCNPIAALDTLMCELDTLRGSREAHATGLDDRIDVRLFGVVTGVTT
jgi:hypothetical protein